MVVHTLNIAFRHSGMIKVSEAIRMLRVINEASVKSITNYGLQIQNFIYSRIPAFITVIKLFRTQMVLNTMCNRIHYVNRGNSL